MKRGPRVENVNLGIVGHVDSGKTALSRALSTQGSTAAFDRHPQSQERGMTLDLGFSVVRLVEREREKEGEREKEKPSLTGGEGEKPSLTTEMGDINLKSSVERGEKPSLTTGGDKSSFTGVSGKQFTIVDCPGHAAFIRTVLGGAQIMDFMLLVIDATKGIQTQTAEALVIAELTTDVLVVALNKVDLFAHGETDPEFVKMRARVAAILAKTKFKDPPMVPVAACPKSGGAPVGLDRLLAQLVASCPRPRRDVVDRKRFLFAVDHCFALKGQGTVVTGTVLRGSVAVGDTVEIADVRVERKVKSMQMFKQPLDEAVQGDRLGICVTQFDASTLERGLVCFPGSVPTVTAAMVSCRRIRYYQGDVCSGARFHVSIGHRTATGRFFFLAPSPDPGDAGQDCYEWQAGARGEGQESLALLRLDAPVLCPDDALYIASKLDVDESAPGCRIAFHGRVVGVPREGEHFMGTHLRLFKRKERVATVERVVSDTEVICKGLFKSFDMAALAGYKLVREHDGAVGEIRASFGAAKHGKFRAVFPGGGCEAMEKGEARRLLFRYKKYLGSSSGKKWVQ